MTTNINELKALLQKAQELATIIAKEHTEEVKALKETRNALKRGEITLSEEDRDNLIEEHNKHDNIAYEAERLASHIAWKLEENIMFK